jgi:protein PhnA
LHTFTPIQTTHNTLKMDVKDSNGTVLSEGDSVKIIKDLKVKGSSATLKRGTLVKNIRLTDDAEEIEGKVERSVLVLKTMFLQKV